MSLLIRRRQANALLGSAHKKVSFGLAVLLSLVVAVLSTRTEGEAATKPNIVLILTDDQRWDTLWAMPKVKRLLLSKGVNFSNAFVVNASCCPSRASILTGKYSHSTGVYKNEAPYGGFSSFRDGSTVATWLKGAGYRTALIGKYLNAYTNLSYIPPGWSRWFAFPNQGGYFDYTVSDNGTTRAYGSATSDYSTDVLAAKAASFITTTPSSRPLFLYFAPKAPHEPFTPAPRHNTAFSTLAPYRPPSYNESDVSDKPAWLRSRPPLSASRQVENDAIRRNQYRTLLAVDDAVGRIVNALANTGRLSNTLIVLTSDNGFHWGEHRLMKAKWTAYEESIRVPLVVRYDPAVAAAREDRRPVLNIDFAPTFATLAGTTAPAAEGASILPLLSSFDGTWRNDFLVEHLKSGEQITTYCAVRDEQYLYVAYETGEKELYDLSMDPYQLQNQANNESYTGILSALGSRLHDLCNPAPPGMAPP